MGCAPWMYAVRSDFPRYRLMGRARAFASVLRNFSSSETLWIYATEIPDDLPGHIARGEFGERITTRCTLPTTVSTSISLPNLKKLIIGNHRGTFRDPTSTYPVDRRPLDSLKLFEKVNKVTEVLAECRFTPRSFCLDIKRVQITNIRRLLTLSEPEISGRSWSSRLSVHAFYIYHHFPLQLLFTSSFIPKAPRLASRHLRLNYVEMH